MTKRKYPKQTQAAKWQKNNKTKKKTTTIFKYKLPYKKNAGKVYLWKTNSMAIKCKYDEDIIEGIKTLPGRRYNHKTKIWTVPYGVNTIENLIKMGFRLHPEITDMYERISGLSTKPDKIEVHPALRDYQREGIAYIESKAGRAILADDMGLGKTAQVLSWLQLHEDALPAVVIMPQTAKIGWAREAMKWMRAPDLYVLYGRPKELDEDEYKKFSISKGFEPDKGEIILVNKDLIGKRGCSYGWADTLPKVKTVVVDEMHHFKHKDTKRSAALEKLCKNAEHVIMMSGTPVEKKTKELYFPLSLTQPLLFPTFYSYAERFCDAKRKDGVMNYDGSSNLGELNEILTKYVMIRRTKEQVLKELPQKQRHIIPVEVPKDKLQHCIQLAAKDSEGEPHLQHVFAGTAMAKMDSSIEWIEEYLLANKKLVVFAWHRNVVEELTKRLAKYNPVKVYGGSKKQEAMDMFQNDSNTRVLVGNIMSAGEAITLTAAYATCTVQLSYTWSKHLQAEDRVHRLGQKSKHVDAYYIIGENTIDDHLMEILKGEADVMADTLDGVAITDDQILAKLNKYHF